MVYTTYIQIFEGYNFLVFTSLINGHPGKFILLAELFLYQLESRILVNSYI